MMKKLLFLTLLLAFGLTGFSQNKTFVNGGNDGFWNNPTNWDPDGVPGTTDDVIIPATFDVTMLAATTAVANTLVVNGSLTMEGTSTLTVGTAGAPENSKTSQATLKEETTDLADKNK